MMPDLLTDEEITLYMKLFKEHQQKKLRREKRNRFLRTWGLGILTVLLVIEVYGFWRWVR